jgi:hypothetical protein
MNQAKPTMSRVPTRRVPARVRQQGASLIEGIAYLGIAAIVVLGAVSLLTGAFGSAKANQTTEEVVALRTAVRKLYMGQVAPANPVSDMVSANVVPNTLGRSTSGTGSSATTTLVNGWGGSVSIDVANSGTFTITYPNVPKDVCMSVINGANGWVQISGASNANATTTFPATLSAATSICAAASNTIVFTAT